MKTYLLTATALIAYFVTSIGFAQQIDEKTLLKMNYFSSIPQQNSQVSGIYINQIGSDNELISNTRAANSDVNYVQIGSNNAIRITDRSDDLSLSVLQNGDQNQVLKYSFFNTDKVDNTYTQNGSNQSLSIFGDNSISEVMKVTMSGDNQNIIMRNFK